MLKQSNHPAKLALCATALALTSTAALSDETGVRFDLNGNGQIERGAEAEAMQAAISVFNPLQITAFDEFMLSQNASLPVQTISSLVDKDVARDCTPNQELYLAQSVSSIRTMYPDVIIPSDRGAGFTWSRDQVAGVSSWSAQGVLAFAPRGASGCLGVDSPDPLDGATLTSYSIIPYLSFNGGGNSVTTNTSDLRVGVQSAFAISGGAFDVQEIAVSPYFRTDFQNEAEIYGLDVTWTPYNFESRLNGLHRNATSDAPFDWTLVGKLSFESVEVAGNSGQTAGTEYGWIGFKTGFGYTFESEGDRSPRFDLSVDANYDVINERSAVLYRASLNVPLSDTGNSSIEYSYNVGNVTSSLQDIEKAQVEFRMSF